MNATEWKERIVRQEWDAEGQSQMTELKNGWAVREEFAIQRGCRIVKSLTISPAGDVIPAGGISARLLRTVIVGQPAVALRQQLMLHHGRPAADAVFESMGWFGRPRKRPRPRYARADDLYYAELARDYVQLLISEQRNPIATLAKQRGAPLVRIRSHIHLARARGLLSDGERGKAAGELTPDSLRILESKGTSPVEGRPEEGTSTP
jgi:hypothetical protein